MFEILCWFGRPINVRLLKTLADMEGWTAELVDCKLSLCLPETSQTIFSISVANTAYFCELIVKHAPGSSLHRAMVEAASRYESTGSDWSAKNTLKIIRAIYGGDKEKAIAVMAARELLRNGEKEVI